MLGKDHFSKDVPLRYHEISLQFIQLYIYCTCRSKSTSILMCVCLEGSALLYITIKTLYNVTRYNRIFNIRRKFAGNGSVSIKIPSLYKIFT